MGRHSRTKNMQLTSFATLAVASAWDFGSYSSAMSYGMSHSWQSPMWFSGHHMWSDSYKNWNGDHFHGMQMWNSEMWNSHQCHMNRMPHSYGSHYWFNNWNNDMYHMHHFNFMSPMYGNTYSSKWSYSPSYYRRHNWFNRSWNNNNFRYYWF